MPSPRTTIVRYKIKPGFADVNEALVRDVYEELTQAQPDGLRYATFKLDDGLTFVHIAIAQPETANPLTGLNAFRRFQEDLRDRCDEAPVVSQAESIGSYKLLDEPLAVRAA